MNDNEQIELYKTALEQVRYEGQLLWQIFNAFLLAHTVFVAFLLQATFGQQPIANSRPTVLVAGVIGLALCILWAATYLRSSAYYIFRMAQAREAEPPGWKLLKEAGEEFSSGRQVRIGANTYQATWLGRNLRTKRSVPLLIAVFAIIYLGIICISVPWW